jgi:two-component system CheB/CheR fusion protein
LFDAQDRVRGSITVAADITAQKHSADALRASEARFRAVQDTFIDGFMVFESVRDEDGKIVDFRWVHVNEGAERILGKPRSWFNGRLLLQEQPGNREAGLFDGYVRVVDTGAPWSIELTYRYDGLDLYLRLVAAKCDDGFAVSFADLTERRRAEEQLRERERQFVGLANAMPNLAWTQAADGAHQYFNRGWYEYTGLTEQQSKQADSWSLVVHPDDQPRVTTQWLQSLRTGWPFEAEYRMRRHDGVYRWFLVRASADRNPAGTIIQWFGTCTDIDATKAIEGTLRHTEAALREADTRKDVFLTTLSHELRNSLAPIGAAAHLLESTGVGATDPARCGSIISRQVTQMASLLDDLLDISKISRGTLTLKKRAFNVREILQAALETAQPLIDAKQHELSVEWPSAAAVLQGDPVRLTQVVTNLLTNAAKYTEAGGHITLSARIEARQCVISVRDTGEGLTPDMLKQVFDLYTQAEPDREQSQSGLGVGLALSKGLIELHGGRIEARSAGRDLGSEFTVSLPLLNANTDAPPAAHVAPETISDSRKARRILIADDNRDGAESLALLLQLSGHQVHVAHTGVESLDMALRLRPEIAILDIGMPGLNGYEVARRIRRERWNSPIILIAVTGWGQLDDKREALAAGFDHHLTKPVDPEVLERLFAAAPEASRRNA